MPALNRKIWGIHKQKLLLIGARTSNGKSMFAINIATDLARQGKRVIFLSLEMPKEKVLERMFCLEEGIDNIDLLTGKYNKKSFIRDKFVSFSNKVNSWRMYIADCIGRDWQWLEKEILNNMKDKPDAIFIDHIQEIRGGQSNKEAIDEYISKMRECSIRHNFALIMCSQVNRASVSEKDTNKEPQLHQLKSTGFLEEASDQVILLHWPYHHAKDDKKVLKEDYLINVAKNRDGMTGYIKMHYDPAICKVSDAISEKVNDQEVLEYDE
jgi:replicative DNA helicase